jgi:predicted transcriptional regulator
MVIYDDQDTGDYFQIQVAQHGATTLTTVDDDAAAADLILSPDGSIELNAAYTELKAMDFDVALQATDPESGSGKIFGSGFADYYTNYVWLGMWDLQPSAEYDTDFGSW